MSSLNDNTPVQEVASPMTNLANSLGTTLTVRRRLTLSESNETPKRSYDNILHDHDTNSSLGVEKNRLFKGNSKNISDNSSLKCLMFQKIMNSPIEKENASMCMDNMIVSKTLASPTQSSPTFLIHNRHIRGRHPLEDHDPNSRDSGFFSVPSDDSRSLNRLIEAQNDKKKLSESFVCPNTNPDVGDEFLDNAISPARLSQDSLPPEFNSLINGDIFSQISPVIKPIVRRKHSRYSTNTPRKSDFIFEDIKNTDNCVRKRKLINELECSSELPNTSKRLKPHVDLSMSFGSPRLDTEMMSLSAPILQKKTTLFDYGFCKKSTPKFQRSFSTSEAVIKAAFEKEDNGLHLIGDFSQSFVLPLLSGRHADLRSISPDTLAQLLEGVYDDFIDSYLIIDCRYPYEYEAGHIRGAINIFTKEHLLKSYAEDKLGKKSPKNDKVGGKRNVLIFHCEFSSERGPSLSRYLRNADRQKNSMCYPYLDYPEMYLLDGGYCKFYGEYSRLCVPSEYISMYDEAHAKDLCKFRSKAKTWAGHNNEGLLRVAGKNTLKRLGFN